MEPGPTRPTTPFSSGHWMGLFKQAVEALCGHKEVSLIMRHSLLVGLLPLDEAIKLVKTT